MEHRKKKTGGFDLERFRALLIKAIGNRTQGKFAEDSGISRITINRLLTLDDVPRPSLKTISNITSASNASIPSIEFYDACGYTYTEYRQSERSNREKMPFPERAAESSKEKLTSNYFVIPKTETVSLPTTQINYGIPLAGISNSVLLKYIISNSRHLRLSTMEETEKLLAVLKEGTEKEILAALKAVNLNPAEAICRIINVKLTSNQKFATLIQERKQILYSFVDPGTETRHGIHNNDDGIFSHPIVRYCSNKDYKEGILPPVIIADEYYTSTLNLETPITNQLIKVVKVLTGEPFINIVASYDVMEIPKDDIATCPRMI